MDTVQQETRPRRKIWLIAGGVLAVLCLCIGVWAALFRTISREEAPLEACIDAFMQAASSGDLDSAYAQFSTRAKQSLTAADIKEYFSHGAGKATVEGYQAVDIENINMSWNANTDATVPQGQVAEVSGTVGYQDGYAGSFSAILEREGSAWRIYGINVTIPPQKLDDYVKGAAR